MNNPFPEIEEFINNFNKIALEAQSNAVYVRAQEIQQEHIDILEDFLKKILAEKEKAAQKSENKKANLILCLELTAKALINELRLIINLKDDSPDLAWQALIDAQSQISSAMRNHPFNGDYLEGYAARLYGYEKLLFPKMLFASRGCTVANSKCSICQRKIENCDHIPGYAYMGEICYEIIEKIVSIDEVSIVPNPADKSCRIISFQKDGKNLDTFTHREIQK
ncbi:hypothetical protein NE848_12940 [Gramella jeungdoensis]|uniref:Uncharacterized protein n=1 Tax=Gramella jeungdoensis TaxID=708091 RepID=A0ABT0Z3I6_9FLAO|nr:hypothetical protein [Gramella jeungdoensis]MCM8570291.1 hypothetical protein [Gramella jeungdoensis]